MKFKNRKEWEAFVDKGISEGKTPQQMNKLAGVYDGPEGRWTVHQKADSERRWGPVNLGPRATRGKKRTGKGKEQDAEFLKTLKAAGLSDEEAKAILQEEKRGYTRTKNLAKRYTDESTTGRTFNVGHETGSGEGGGDYKSNARVELGKSIRDEDGNIIKRGNQSRGLNDEFADPVKPAMGVPRSGRGGRDTALKHLLIRDNPKIMDLGLTPKNRQDIRANPSQANEIILARQEQLAAIEEVKTSGKPISAAKALRIARMGAPLALSLGFSAAAMGTSAHAAWEDPTADNIEDAAWDTVNFTADALSLIPILAAPMEGAQKLLGWGHLSRMATRNLNAGQQAKKDLENLEINP